MLALQNSFVKIYEDLKVVLNKNQWLQLQVHFSKIENETNQLVKAKVVSETIKFTSKVKFMIVI